MFDKSIAKDERTMYDGLGETVYTNLDYRCICDTNPSLIHQYDRAVTHPIFKDYKNELGYQGEAVLLEKIKSLHEFTFPSDIDVLLSVNDKSIMPLLSKHKWEKGEGERMMSLIKQLRIKSEHYDKIIDEDHELYSIAVCKFIIKLKNYYRKMKKIKESQSDIYKSMTSFFTKLKHQELKKQKTKSNQLIGFFREFTDLQIIYNIIKSVSIDRAVPIYYTEVWKVMFIPQQHYTVTSYDPNKLNQGMHHNAFPSLVTTYNNKFKRLISYNTPFVTIRHIRKLLDIVD